MNLANDIQENYSCIFWEPEEAKKYSFWQNIESRSINQVAYLITTAH
jgi:Txe/YoeB family toxin of Txe-Axe toxin-antitoxin module